MSTPRLASVWWFIASSRTVSKQGAVGRGEQPGIDIGEQLARSWLLSGDDERTTGRSSWCTERDSLVGLDPHIHPYSQGSV